jgi:DNA-binding SARP family transcriptional activator
MRGDRRRYSAGKHDTTKRKRRSESLALAKISRPRLGKVFPRTRVFKLLDHARERPITWVVAPPGAGKTTLIASYIADRKLPGLWYQLDEGDADPATFFYYLGLAAHGASHGRRRPLPLLTPEYILGRTTFARNFFRELYSRFKPPFAIVFDNYNELPETGEIHELLRVGVEEIPPGGSVIIVSRDDPPATWARLQLSQTMSLLEWLELCLTPEETRDIAHLLTAHEVSADVCERLHSETQGWVVGLVLLLERRPDNIEDTQRAHADTPQVLFDYFAAEVFDKTDSASQQVLLKTSLLPSVSVASAQSLTGLDEAGEILAALSRRHYLTHRLDHAEAVYRYHPLFCEFLQVRARAAFAPEELKRLQQQAAVLLEASGELEAAAELFADAQDWNGLSRLIFSHAPVLLAQGRHRTLKDWLAQLPSEHVERDPWLLYWLGACNGPFQPTEARVYFEKAFALFEALNNPEGLYLTWCEIVDNYVNVHQDFKSLDHWLETLERLMVCQPTFPSMQVEARVVASAFGAFLWRQPHHPSLAVWCERLETLLHGPADTRGLLGTSLGHLILYYCVWTADRARARALLEGLREAARMPGISPFVRIYWRLAEGLYLWLADDATEDCLKAVQAGLKEAQESGVHVLDYYLLAQGAYANLNAARLDDAAAFLQQMSTAAVPYKALYHSIVSWEALLRGDVPRAVQDGKIALDQAEQIGLPFHQAQFALRLAYALAQTGELDDAIQTLTKASRLAENMKNLWLQHQCLLLEAYLAFTQNQTDAGLMRLREGLAFVSQQNRFGNAYAHPKVDGELCAKALEHNIDVEYVKKLIRRRRLLPDPSMAPLDVWPYRIKIYTLGRFAVLIDDEPLRFAGKAQKKPLELLKALIALGGRVVREEVLAEALWPEGEGDAAAQALATTLHRLRRLLGTDALHRQEGRLTLDAQRCWVDAWALERALATLENELNTGEFEALSGCIEKAVRLYRGGFLEGESDMPWVLVPRERLRGKLLRTLEVAGDALSQNGHRTQAIACCEKALEVEPLAEEFYRALMRCHLAQGHRAQALGIYRRCRRLLTAELGLTPSPETEALYQEIQEN